MHNTHPQFVRQICTGSVGKSWYTEKHFGVELWQSQHCLDGCVLGGQTHGRDTKVAERRAWFMAGQHVDAAI